MVLKRVRREIRDLPLNEWNDVVDAMWIMKRTEDIDGKKKYGRFYISYDTLVAKHITASLDPRGDQAHFGPVLGLFHRGWLLQLENSLMAINPNIKALPYWDYGRDINPSAPGYVDIFSDQYFGSFVGRGPDYAVIDGKFAKWPVARYSSTHGKYSWQNPYGFMRHPLSVNKSPFVTRNGGSMCGFSLGLGQQDSWDQCLNVGDAIMDWSMCVDSRVHGPAHSSIAGTWRRDGQDRDSPNCAQWYGFIGAPNSVSRMGNLRASSPYPYGTFISPYSAGCFSCPRCQLSDNPSDCMCTPTSSSCGPLWTQLRMPNTLRTGSRFIDTSRMSTLIPAGEIQILGDLGDPAGSPNDPMFWAHHANIDRHFETWMHRYTTPMARSNYYYFPSTGFAPGCNLRDVISSNDPFIQLSRKENNIQPYTVKGMIDRFTGKNTPYTYDSLVTNPQKIHLRGDSEIDLITGDHKETKNGPFLRAVPVTSNVKTYGNLRNFHDYHHDEEITETVEDEENLEDDLHENIPQSKKNIPQGHLRKVIFQNEKNLMNMKYENDGNGNGEIPSINKKKHLRTPSSDEWNVNYVEAEQFHIEQMNESNIPIQSYLRTSSKARLDDSGRPLARHVSGEIFYTVVTIMFAVSMVCFWRLWTTRNSTIPTSRRNTKLAVAVTKEMRYNKYEIVSPDSVKTDGSLTRRRTRTNSEATKKKNSSSTNTFLLFSPQPEQ